MERLINISEYLQTTLEWELQKQSCSYCPVMFYVNSRINPCVAETETLLTIDCESNPLAVYVYGELYLNQTSEKGVYSIESVNVTDGAGNVIQFLNVHFV
jgi:hypothetical protein